MREYDKSGRGATLGRTEIQGDRQVKRYSSKSIRSSLKGKLDNIFSKWRRLKEVDKDGFCVCITCGKRLYWKEIQTGHYITRNYMATRWLEENTAPQCVGCNIFGKGRPDVFAIRIQEKYGKDELEKLNLVKNQIYKYHNYDLEMMIKFYKREFEEQCAKFMENHALS